MKYALVDGEIHSCDSDPGQFAPLTMAEAQAVVDTMNLMHATLPCDVPLPPATVFRKGVSLSTLVFALQARGMVAR